MPTAGPLGQNGTILHWDGASWSQVTSPTAKGLDALAMVSAADGWAMGSETTMLHWNGVDWGVISEAADLPATTFLTASDGWAVGSGGSIQHWDGSAWSPVASPTSDYIGSVDMIATDDGWAAVPFSGDLLHWDGELDPLRWARLSSSERYLHGLRHRRLGRWP
ncbi:MAG: hypothetical protein R2844_23275 [Caldilineales bacterium]